MPPESSVVIPCEEHIANVELEECEPQPDGHVIAVDIVWVHSVLHALTTRSASVRTPWSLCDEQRQRGNSLCGKPPPKAATRKRCANVKSEAEASQRDWVAGAPPEQLPARAALIWRQIGRLAPREPGEIWGLEWRGQGRMRVSACPSTRTCCGTQRDSTLPTTVSTRARFKPISATATSCTLCVIPSLRQIGFGRCGVTECAGRRSRMTPIDGASRR
jgi:hypothetical protein